MKIGINALYLLPGRVGGTEVYLRNLLKALYRLDGHNEYVVFLNRESAGLFKELEPRFRLVRCPVRAVSRPLRILWEELVLPFQLIRHGVDVLLSAGMTTPFVSPCRTVLVIYDLQHVNQPWNFSRFYLPFLKSIIYLSAKVSDRIVVISNKVKNDVARHYRIASDHITVAYPGVDTGRFRPRSAEELIEVKKKYSLPERYILYAAASLPHKNHARLLEAYRLVRREAGDVGLVLTGARDYGGESIVEKIKELGLEKDVVFLGWLPFDDVPLLYCASDVFVYPSLHEGFGMPIIEAMACKVPVVSSSIEPLEEIAGGAALLVDPFDHKSIAEGILRVLKDEDMRKSLVDRGLKRAAAFNWEDTASKVLSAVEACGAAK